MDLFRTLKNMKLLLIDDDAWIRGSLSLFFEGEGCQIRALETAEEGLEELRTRNYDFIIVDYKLPGMDGLEFLERIKDDHPDAMKMFITAYGSDDVFTKAKELGVREFIQKPFSSDAIEKALSRLMVESPSG
jgi:CheY-like chemotaxis protein